MARKALRPSERLIALAPSAAALISLTGAIAALVASFFLDAPITLALPLPAPSGGLAFALEPGRAGVLCALLIAGAAGLLTAPRITGGIAMLVFTSCVILQNNLYTLVFSAFIVLFLVRHLRSSEPIALASLPVVLLALGRATGLHDALVIAGSVALVAGFLWAALAADLARLARAVTFGFTGLALLAAGLGDVAATRLTLEVGILTAPVLAIAAATIASATGTSAPDWLGGLARGMPRFSVCLAGALAFASLLPPAPGFVAFRAVFIHALAAGGWPGGLAAASLATGFALAGFAALRAFGLICLGRPRSLRAAAAEDASRRTLLALGLPVACGIALALRAAPFALLVPCAVLLPLARHALRTGPIDMPPFDNGFARPPAWLPFGDPATQINATGFAGPLRALLTPLTERLPAPLRARLRP